MKFVSKLIDKRIEEYQSTLAKVHYDEVENMYKEMRGWRHDYKHHMGVLKKYAEDGDLDRVITYLGDLSDDLSKTDQRLKTGNKMTDAILNSKISLAREKQITVHAEVQVITALTTPEIDLCIILGNLFDNAMEASLKLPVKDRLIRIYMTMKQNNQLYISFTNYTATKKQLKENGRFKSTKGKNHGFGLVRIDQIIDRHGGYLNRNSEDGAFSTEILLPQ